MKCTPFLLLLFSLLGSCSNEGQQNRSATEKPSSNVSVLRDTANKNHSVLNNIILEEKGGLQVSAAFLADEGGSLVNPQNTVQSGIPVFLTLLIQEGWSEEGGFVSPGATQTITTHNGEPVMRSGDLFATVPRIKRKDAARLRLKLLLRNSRPDIPFYLVRFRIWDKRGNGQIAGQYRLQVEK